MIDKKTKVDCHLITRGTKKVNAKVIDDLAISDPELIIGKQIIQKAIEGGLKDDSKSGNS